MQNQVIDLLFKANILDNGQRQDIMGVLSDAHSIQQLFVLLRDNVYGSNEEMEKSVDKMMQNKKIRELLFP